MLRRPLLRGRRYAWVDAGRGKPRPLQGVRSPTYGGGGNQKGSNRVFLQISSDIAARLVTSQGGGLQKSATQAFA
jgi:hypothetical protein